MKRIDKIFRMALLLGYTLMLSISSLAQVSKDSLLVLESETDRSSSFGRANSVQSTSTTSKLDLTTTNDQTAVNALLSFNIGGSALMSIRASSPFEKGQNQFIPVTARGVSGNSSLEIGFQFSDFQNASFTTTTREFRDKLKKLEEKYKTNDQISDTDRITSLLDVKKQSVGDYNDLLQYLHLGTVKKYGFSINWTKQSFSFTNDLTNIEKLNEERNAVTISASYGILNQNNTFYKFSLRSENYFKSAQSVEYQIPSTVAGITRTEQLAVGKPSEVNDVRLRFEIQKYTGANMAINPNLNLLLESEQAIFEFPVYILRSKKNNKLGGLNGGLFASWQSDFDDISFRSENLNIGVFIGTDFDFGK